MWNGRVSRPRRAFSAVGRVVLPRDPNITTFPTHLGPRLFRQGGGMVTITLIEDPDDTQRQLFDDWAEVFAADGRHLFGADHTARSADELREMGRSTDRHRIPWAAVDDAGTVVGAAGLVMPQHDNLSQALVLVVVHPDHRRRGVGTVLLDHAEA